MSPASEDWEERSRELLASAEGGNSLALGQLLELFRGYLVSIAREEIQQDLQGKVNPSDVVQDTFLEACRIFSRFRGTQTEELRKWLRGILLNKLRELRNFYLDTRKRQAGLEQSLDDSSVKPPHRLRISDDSSTPSSQLVRKEETLQLNQALALLPEEYRQVLKWRNWESLSFVEIGQRLQRSEDAARMLFTRALARLQREMEAVKGGSS